MGFAWVHVPALEQEDFKFNVSLVYSVRLCPEKSWRQNSVVRSPEFNIQPGSPGLSC